jgi:predicted DNA-binding transcriptional regulator YafY
MADRGRDGGYRLIHGFKLPPMMFTNDEALALGLGLVATRSLGLVASTPASNSALSKIERVMPEKLRQRLRAVGETVSLDIAKASSSGNPDILALLSAATRDQQSVHLRYLTPQRVQTDRKIDPYGLAYLSGSWYVIAHCHLRKDNRSFRLDRIQSASLLPMSFGRPADFDAMRYITGAIATIPRAHQIKVLLHAEVADARVAIFSAFGMLEPVADCTILTIQADDLEWVARELARLPFSFVIREPALLNEVLTRHAMELLKIGRRPG